MKNKQKEGLRPHTNELKLRMG